MSFTQAELAEMRIADREIERTFRMEAKDYEMARIADRDALKDSVDQKGMSKLEKRRKNYLDNVGTKRKQARDHYASNKEKCLERNRRYRQSNKEKVNANARRYLAENREKIAKQRIEWIANRKALNAADGAEIRRIRLEHGYSTSDVAMWLDVSKSTIWEWESGTNKANYKKLATIFPEFKED